MGDRANVAVQDHGKRVYLYTHWDGYELPELVRMALARRQRWNDAPYLTRILFCTLVAGAEKDETGFGISTEICDNEHPIIIVDCDKQIVTIEAEPGGRFAPTAPQRLSFSTYADLAEATWQTLDTGR